MTTLLESALVTITWADPEQSILTCHVKRSWAWADAYTVITVMRDACDAQPHPVYVIFAFASGVRALPQGNPLKHLDQLTQIESQNNPMTVMVGVNGFVRWMINLNVQHFGLRHAVEVIRVVETMDDAFTLIAAHRSDNAAQTA